MSSGCCKASIQRRQSGGAGPLMRTGGWFDNLKMVCHDGGCFEDSLEGGWLEAGLMMVSLIAC